MALANLWSFFMPISMAIDSNCDYYQDVALGQQYYIYNQDYPSYYPPSTSCRWIAKSPIETVIVISCEEIDLPSVSRRIRHIMVQAFNNTIINSVSRL